MKSLKILALLALLAPTLLLAEEHVAIGSRPMSEEAAAQIEAEKAPPATEEEEGTLETLGFIYDSYPPIYYSNSHHWLVAVTIMDNDQYTLELEDGSVWKINNYDGMKALNWRANDPLTITQNTRWFTRHDYRIINKANGTSVEANLFLGPIAIDPSDPYGMEKAKHSRMIIGIDYSRREVILSDNTHWEISYLDSSIFKDWALNDYLIIGTNSNTSIWDSGSDALLINVNMNNCARAKQF